jgi:hypothetical protein
MGNNVIHLGLKPVEIWPRDLKIESRGDPSIRLAAFADTQEYHPRLIAKILELEEHQRLRQRGARSTCGARIPHLDQWLGTEAQLITSRARALFRHVVGSEQAVVDISWASVYRAGDYCPPRSQTRSTATVVYCLDMGEADPQEALGGRLCFVDPRLRDCCPDQEGCVTVPFVPPMTAGTMLIFPSQLVHTVNPYTGSRPRILLSWNINKNALPGAPLPADAP